MSPKSSAQSVSSLARRLLLLGLAIVGMMAGFTLWQIAGSGTHSAPVTLLVAPGDSLTTIARKVSRAELTPHPIFFRVAAMIGGTPLQAGEYFIAPEASLLSVARQMHQGIAVVQHPLTIAEGLTSREIIAILQAHPLLAGDEELVLPEGAALPETYYFTRATRRATLLARMQQAQTKLLARLWAQRDKTLPLASPEEAVVLASIVEKEAANQEEMPRIAAVFINRLRQGMKLQADPTVIYAVTGGAYKMERPLSRRDLRHKGKHNTYVHFGLPPTPIAAPGRNALHAVFHPAPVDDLFFVSNGNGHHVFSKTFEEHERHVAALRALEKKRKQSKP